MKKVLSVILILCIILSSFLAFNVMAEDEIKVIVKDEQKVFDQMPLIKDGRTLVPMRGIFEALGAAIYWDDATKSAVAKKSGKTIALTIGEKSAVVDGEFKALDVAPEIINGRTMVPVRFVSESLGEEVKWDATSRTVSVGKGKSQLAELKNTVHRPVPTEFTKSSALDDLIYYEAITQEEFEAGIPDKYEEIISPDDLLDPSQMEIQVEGLDAKTSVVGVDGADFVKALRVEVNQKPEKDTNVILRFNRKISGMKAQDACLVTFRMRCVKPVEETGKAMVKVQVEHPETFEKALFTAFDTDDINWTKIYMVFYGRQDCENVAIRFGYGPQIVEIGDFSIKNFGQGVKLPMAPIQSHNANPDLVPEASWRKDAYDNIEKIRKGDFNIIVKDKEGNVIPDANVELDMFDHQFEWGCIYRNHPDFTKLFNATLQESIMKWGMYQPGPALANFEKAFSEGIRYFRGHSIIFEKLISGRGNKVLDLRCGEAVEKKDKEMLNKLISDHVNDIMPRFDKYVTDWDVENEMYANSLFRDAFGNEYVKEIYEIARKADPDGKMFYNECAVYQGGRKKFEEIINWLIEYDVDVDAIGLQSHMDDANITIAELQDLYDYLYSKGFSLKVTEFSCGNIQDELLRASYMRDFMIHAFSHEGMEGFYLWGFKDGDTYATHSLFYDELGNRKPCIDQWEDLIYNKWWTRDAKANTDANGKATIRGFYGDYDVTVTANGVTKTAMAAFHKGYNNTLEIVLD